MNETPNGAGGDSGQDGGQNTALPPHLRNLARLVTVLTVVMIAGLLTVVALLVIRLTDTGGPRLLVPEEFALPPGVNATGMSVAGDVVVLTGDDGILRLYDAQTGALEREIDPSAE